MAPEKKVTQEMLPLRQLEIKNNYDIKVGIVHYRNLKYYLSLVYITL